MGDKKVCIILTQGLNRQIRRTTKILGNNVVKLKRTRVVNITLGDLKPGEFRELTEEEIGKLRMKLEM
jgi:23S rRNA pseudouridine2604 synthase